MTENRLPIEDGITNNEITFEETDDVGHILRILRENHGYSIIQLSKMIGFSPERISRIERSITEPPSEAHLRMWLQKLGCKDNIKKILLIARQHRVVHYVRLHAQDKSNFDLIRLLEAYKDKSLSEFDRSLLSVIGR